MVVGWNRLFTELAVHIGVGETVAQWWQGGIEVVAGQNWLFTELAVQVGVGQMVAWW